MLSAFDLYIHFQYLVLNFIFMTSSMIIHMSFIL